MTAPSRIDPAALAADPYRAFLDRKLAAFAPTGIEDVPPLNPAMFPHQRDVTDFLLRCGRGAAFLDTGLGKSLVALDWGRIVSAETGKPVLMLAPLAVSQQHAREAAKFGIEARVVRTPDEIGPGVNVTNYEKVDRFDPAVFGGIVLDESSIIKSFTGATTRKMMAMWENTPFRLACTATPAPNDHMELGQHSQFLGVMDSDEMLARWFIADQRNMGRYRLKRYAVKPFWSWIASYCRCIAKPSDLGYSDDGFVLPPLNVHRHVIKADISVDTGGLLFRVPDTSATAIHKEKRLTKDARSTVIADIVNAERGEPWIVWCDTDYEADALTAMIPDAVEVRGSMPADMKEDRLVAFSTGNARILVTKPSIAGHGLNLQHCARMAFVGLSFSYESYYQAIRRCWRFGQKRPVEVHIAMADTERAIWDVVSRKAGDHDAMKVEMIAAMRRAVNISAVKHDYEPTVPLRLPDWLGASA